MTTRTKIGKKRPRKRSEVAPKRTQLPGKARKPRRSTTKDDISDAADSTGVTDLAAQASESPLNAANPIIGLQSGDIASAAKSLLKLVAGSPVRATQHLNRYVAELRGIVAGESAIAPDPKDRRFADSAWKSNAMYRRLLQSWLATQKGLSGYIEQTRGNAREKGQAQFFVSLLTDALASGG